MRSFICATAFLVTAIPPAVRAGEAYGFGELAFGTKYETVLSSLIAKHQFKKSPDDSTLYNGPNSMKLTAEEMLRISNYSLGGSTFDLHMDFNQNKKFYNFMFEGRERPEKEFETQVMDDVKFLSKVFEKKYGEPDKKFRVLGQNIKEGYNSLYWKWVKDNVTIYTAVGKRNNNYYAKAVVMDEKLNKEELEFFDGKKSSAVDDAAKSF
jgi:hypothetical protein